MSKKILIIEDDPFLGEVLVQKLSISGYEATLSQNGAEGLKKMREMKPDLVLLDILLPRMNGYEVMEEKMKDAAIASIPIIIISNSGQPVEISRALSLGAKDYLIKASFNPDEVLAKVRKQIDGAENAPTANGEHKNSEKKSAKLFSGEKILLVEDDLFLGDIISRKLISEGLDFIRAGDGEEVFKILQTQTPDIILLDILLPIMDGFEILEKLKADPRWKAIPVILFSNLSQKSEIERGMKLGAARFVVKVSMTPSEIVEEVRHVLLEAKAAKAAPA
ncbi:MAG: response regulator [Patescibacteria group bacterium]